MQFFNNMKLKSRLVSIVLLPLFGFLYFSIDTVSEKYLITMKWRK